MTQILPPTRPSIESAAEALRRGQLVAFPTETVYGLGGDATSDRAVAAIFEAKGRPRFNPLIAHVPHIDSAKTLVRFDERTERLANAFWPGALTLVLERAADCPVSLLASAGLDTLAVRVPSHPVAQALLRAVGRPVAAPSANRSGRVSPTTAEHVVAELQGRVALVLDGGACPVGLESTVLDLSTPTARLLRPGGLPLESIEARIGAVERVEGIEGEAPRAPGMLESHYAPERPLRLNVTEVRPDEALLAFGDGQWPRGAVAVRWLSHAGDLREAAANLFAMLRELDQPEFAGIAVMPIPEVGLGLAINDRLRRAAVPRP